MIGMEFDFHNENDYSESDRKMLVANCIRWETAVYEKADKKVTNIYRIDMVYNILTYW